VAYIGFNFGMGYKIKKMVLKYTWVKFTRVTYQRYISREV